MTVQNVQSFDKLRMSGKIGRYGEPVEPTRSPELSRRVQSASLFLLRVGGCIACHSEESFGHAQDKFRDEESALGFIASEHQDRFDWSTKKSRSFARAQDDTGAILGLRQSLPQGGRKQPRADIQR
jgi:hypothetical protein